jgi:hypothetical protein
MMMTRRHLGILLLGLLSLKVVPAADLKPDEQVVFFPTLAWRAPGGWEADLHGCIFEVEPRAALTPLLRAALDIDEAELSPEEKTRFHERARLFMVDHERGRSVTVNWMGQIAPRRPVRLGPSEANGHLTGRVQLKDEELARWGATNGLVRFETVRNPDARPGVTGEVHLVNETGWSVISDIDDTLKISAVRDRRELVRNTFCRPFQPVPGMAPVYQRWARTQSAQFHYVSASPWQLYPPLADFARRHGFPAGSFHLKYARILDGTVLNLFQSPETYKPGVIEPLLERFPKRRFVLVGDSGERDPEIYAALARKFPGQIVRILIRDVTGEAADAPRYGRVFEGLPGGLWQIFQEPDAIRDAVR